jgi:GMP synthase-like glutamine amidotransferase
MKIHCVQHVPFEGSANIEAWARDRSHDLSNTLLFEGKSLPEMEEFDWLIIMGGPMNIYEEDKYPWLRKEKEFIKRAIASDKIVLGICLGAQLMADALGGNVHKNMHREIGWFPVNLTPAAKKSRIFGVLPERFMAMHWHGDTFDLPPGALHAAESQACSNQAFELEKAIGLQFHLESSSDSIDRLLLNCKDELTDGQHVQRAEEILAHLDRLPDLHSLMELFLDNIEEVLG